MKNLPALTKLKVQKAAPIIVDHVLELLAPFDVQQILESTADEIIIKPTTIAEVGEDDWKKFWRYQSHFTLEFCKALEQSIPEGYTFLSYNHLTNDLSVVRDNGN
ncbi:MAG: hypothetical protein CMN91_00015 [Synechococcus sp. ARS1019]|nr:hypothetical protein [Synechococcus sp. ARS1019]|tara:strand:- start:7554 stop:7868 length:315 start_codon:yes stop_codon:yes gene_type:complete